MNPTQNRSERKEKSDRVVPEKLWYRASLLFLIILFLACSNNTDIQILLSSCQKASVICEDTCGKLMANTCLTGCTAGLNACQKNISAFPPNEWQPGDAFYDGCTSSTDHKHLACTDGQLAATCISQITLRKYGTSSSCMWIPGTLYDSSALGEVKALESYLEQLKIIQQHPLSQGLKLNWLERLYCNFFPKSFFDQSHIRDLRDLIDKAISTAVRFWDQFAGGFAPSKYPLCYGGFSTDLQNAIDDTENRIDQKKKEFEMLKSMH